MSWPLLLLGLVSICKKPEQCAVPLHISRDVARSEYPGLWPWITGTTRRIKCQPWTLRYLGRIGVEYGALVFGRHCSYH